MPSPTRILLSLALLIATPTHSDTKFLTPGDNLVQENIPKIPTALADDIRPYTEFRGAGITSWHPTRREMLIYTRFADTTQIHLVKFPGGARTQLTFFTEPVWDADYQPTAGDYFVFAKDIGGNENYQKYRFDLSPGKVTLLTDGKSRNTGGIFSNAGDKFAYDSTRRTGRDTDIWIVDPSVPRSDKLIAQLTGGGWSAEDFSLDDAHLILHESVSINESYLWLLDISTGEKTLITPKNAGAEEKIAYENPQFSRDGKGIYCTTDRDSEFRRLTYIDLATRQHTYLSQKIPWDISSFRLSWDGKFLAYISNEDGLSILHILDTTTGQDLPQPTLPIGIIGNLHWHKNNRDLGFNFIDSRRGSDAYSIDVTALQHPDSPRSTTARSDPTSQPASSPPNSSLITHDSSLTSPLTRWTFSETGGINTDHFSQPHLIHWKTFDDRTISGWLYPPPEKFTGKRPVIIEIHGGPEGQARPWLGAGDSYLVNELGIILIQPNIRGSSGYGKSFLKLDNAFKREDSYKDIGALLDAITTSTLLFSRPVHGALSATAPTTSPSLDPTRIMVTGGSYGGHMTLAIATSYPDRIRCALDVVGPSNLATFLEHTSGYRQDLRRVEYGDERDPKMREFLNRIAPLNNASKITKPLFIVQGTNDPRVPASESMQIVQTLKASHTPVWYLEAKDEGHGFAKKKNADYLFYCTVMFVKQYLLN